jgi:hypothetical protein
MARIVIYVHRYKRPLEEGEAQPPLPAQIVTARACTDQQSDRPTGEIGNGARYGRFLRITGERCGKDRMVNQVHAPHQRLQV